jgi:tetratricopeptide (TPR) repeat protein
MAETSLKDGIRLYKGGDYEGSLVALLAVPAGNPSNNLELAYYIGLCYARLERYDDSLVYLEQVVTADTDLARVYQCRMLLSVIYSLTGRTRLADFELKKLIESGYESTQVFCSLGFIAWEHTNAEEAVSWYEKALSLDANNPTALNGLGYVLACEGKDVARALTCCRKAVDSDPENPAYLDSLGWAYYRLGFEAEAREYLSRALERAPGEAEIREHARSLSIPLPSDEDSRS